MALTHQKERPGWAPCEVLNRLQSSGFHEPLLSVFEEVENAVVFQSRCLGFRSGKIAAGYILKSRHILNKLHGAVLEHAIKALRRIMREVLRAECRGGTTVSQEVHPEQRIAAGSWNNSRKSGDAAGGSGAGRGFVPKAALLGKCAMTIRGIITRRGEYPRIIQSGTTQISGVIGGWKRPVIGISDRIQHRGNWKSRAIEGIGILYPLCRVQITQAIGNHRIVETLSHKKVVSGIFIR